MKPRKKVMACLSGCAKNCQKQFLTTPEYRICTYCREKIDVMMADGSGMQKPREVEDSLLLFWSSLS